MKPGDVPVPSRMRGLDRDARGYPIPVVVYRDHTGHPHFTINDDVLRAAIIARDLCSICGGKLFRGRWFVGGPQSAFHEHGAYLDPPMHGECARYALRVCPYLAAPSYSHRVDARTLKPGGADVLLYDPTMIAGRPDVFVAVLAIGHRRTDNDYLVPNRPYLKIEWWRGGVPIKAPE